MHQNVLQVNHYSMDMVDTHMVLEKWILFLGGNMKWDTMNLFEIMDEIVKLKDDLISIRKDILKMIDNIEENQLHIKQLNWKLKNKEVLDDVRTKIYDQK